jgi:hypothetical protein
VRHRAATPPRKCLIDTPECVNGLLVVNMETLKQQHRLTRKSTCAVKMYGLRAASTRNVAAMDHATPWLQLLQGQPEPVPVEQMQFCGRIRRRKDSCGDRLFPQAGDGNVIRCAQTQ